MSILSFQFISFVGIVFLLTMMFPLKGRSIMLLVANMIFLFSFGNMFHVMWLFIMSFFTFVVIKHIEKTHTKNPLIFGIVLIVLSLSFFKYNQYLGFNNIVLPLGISFYSFKMISALVDVYQEKSKPVNLIKYMTYISFFPVFTAGPIQRIDEFSQQLDKKYELNYIQIKNGAVQCAFGMFEKMVFADYLSIVCTQIFSNQKTLGWTLIVGIILYSFQIYLDFDAYSNIAIGVSRLLGIEIQRNFHTPYLSSSIMEFWDRWHISLSNWLKDYIYIPLGGNRKGIVRKYINVLCVFVVSGLWHGSTVCYLIWGIGHGMLNVAENIIKTMLDQIKFLKSFQLIMKVLGVFVNFVLVSLLWVFFRSTDIQEVFSIFSRMVQWSGFTFDLKVIGLTIREGYWLIVLVVSTILLDLMRYKTDMILWLSKRHFLIRWTIYVLMIAIVIVFGVYGPGYNAADFIYASF